MTKAPAVKLRGRNTANAVYGILEGLGRRQQIRCKYVPNQYRFFLTVVSTTIFREVIVIVFWEGHFAYGKLTMIIFNYVFLFRFHDSSQEKH